MGWFTPDKQKYDNLKGAWVLPAPGRCVQCGVCSYHCPMQIDVRRHVWLGQPVYDSHCLTCGECVERCPRGLLRFQPIGSAMPEYATAQPGDEACDVGPVAAGAGTRTGD